MDLETRHFGKIEVDEKGIVNFPEGLPGFEDAKKFILLGGGDDSPFRWLQSVDRPELAFVVVNPFSIKKDYDIDIPDNVLERLEIENTEDMQLYSIVVVPEDVSKMSMNLKAPVIINVKNKKGAQVVLDTDVYGVRHYILDELRKQEDLENACVDTEKGSIHCNK